MHIRSQSKDISELHDYAVTIAERINNKYASSSYVPVVWLDRPVPLYEKIALYSIADVAVVTATRDGMNLVPYEYIVCRQGPKVCLFKCILQLHGALQLLPQQIRLLLAGYQCLC